jgi:hypothetical protein
VFFQFFFQNKIHNKLKMEVLLRSCEFDVPFDLDKNSFITFIRLLLSATCIGNDTSKPACPLLHGSLAPKIIARASSKYDPYDTSRRIIEFILLNSHIAPSWTGRLIINSGFSEAAIRRLRDSRYSSRSLTKLNVVLRDNDTPSHVVQFVKEHCTCLEQVFWTDWKAGSPSESSLTIFAKSGGTLRSLDFEVGGSYQHDLSPLSIFTALQNLKIRNGTITDIEFVHLGLLKQLRKLKLRSVKGFTGSTFEQAFLTMNYLSELSLDKDSPVDVTGIRVIQSLRTLSLNVDNFSGTENWEYFPHLESLSISRFFTDTRDQPDYFERMETLPSITFLGVWGFHKARSSFGLSLLKKCSRYSLQSVNLNVDHVDSALLNCIGTFRKLSQVRLSADQLPSSIDHLFPLSKLSSSLKNFGLACRHIFLSTPFHPFLIPLLLGPCRNLETLTIAQVSVANLRFIAHSFSALESLSVDTLAVEENMPQNYFNVDDEDVNFTSSVKTLGVTHNERFPDAVWNLLASKLFPNVEALTLRYPGQPHSDLSPSIAKFLKLKSVDASSDLKTLGKALKKVRPDVTISYCDGTTEKGDKQQESGARRERDQ